MKYFVIALALLLTASYVQAVSPVSSKLRSIDFFGNGYEIESELPVLPEADEEAETPNLELIFVA